MSEKETPPETTAPVLVVGLNPERDRVVIVVEVAGERPLRVQFVYDREEAAKLAMSLVKSAHELKPSSQIVLPANAKTMRMPGTLR